MSMETLRRKVQIYLDEDFDFHATIVDGEYYLHLETKKWSPSTYKMMKGYFKDFLSYMKENGVAQVFTISPNPKFVKMFGGEVLGKVIHEEKEYEVIRWELIP